ncbi:hypothetical protein OHAE_2001 [Ochrobactrum soli]|uniref:Uncharacterized protein n=1 Tax=Ochrobactrum soli TaxID=2448455 RepID=A0A2P9HPS0_9HYPH|nr:hypothetical protein OHAE_2001 [[Ochrobactrum] soli]
MRFNAHLSSGGPQKRCLDVANLWQYYVSKMARGRICG